MVIFEKLFDVWKLFEDTEKMKGQNVPDVKRLNGFMSIVQKIKYYRYSFLEEEIGDCWFG